MQLTHREVQNTATAQRQALELRTRVPPCESLWYVRILNMSYNTQEIMKFHAII